MIHGHFDGFVSHVTDFQKYIRKQFALNRNLPTRGIGIARIGIVERDVLADEGGQTKTRARRPLNAVWKWIGQRARLRQKTVVGGYKGGGLAKPWCIVAGDAIRKVIDAGAAADDRLRDEARGPRKADA